MKEKSIESLLEELKLQRNACIGMDLEGNPEAEQRLARAKLESLEGELLYTVARHVIEIEKEIAEINKSDELPGDKAFPLRRIAQASWISFSQVSSDLLEVFSNGDELEMPILFIVLSSSLLSSAYIALRSALPLRTSRTEYPLHFR